jgi:hypothetical protein
MYCNYIKTIEKQLLLDNPNDYYFKSDKDYTPILEHCNLYKGNQYLFEIKKKYNKIYTDNKTFLIELCKKNDLYGKPYKSNIPHFTSCSPSNLRYILHSFLILDYIKENKLNNIDFIEIGGGYGGLCFFIINLSKIFNITINSYTIFDLKQVSHLQNKYLEALDIKNEHCDAIALTPLVSYYQLDNFKNLKTNSFLISNYAFSEISKELQDEYIVKIINPYTTYGFLAWNFINVYNFVNNSKIIVEKEYPLTANRFNYYVRFKPFDKPSFKFLE